MNNKKSNEKPSFFSRILQKVKTKYVTIMERLLVCAILFVAATSLFAPNYRAALSVNAQENMLINTRDGLLTALQNAKEGETLFVGDIDFGLPDLPIAVTINKTVTIKSGKDGGTRAKFKNGAFKVDSLSSNISVNFEGVDFEGPSADARNFLTDNLGYFADGQYVPPQIKKNIFSAIYLTGDVEATVKSCSFSGYADANGGAITADNHSQETANKKLSLKIENADFFNNAAVLGGSVCILGTAQNVSLSAKKINIKDCYAQNGGAIYAKGAKIRLYHSEFSKNASESSSSSFGKGGAVCLDEGSWLNALGCKFNKNSSKDGGAIYAKKSLALINGCVIALNEARENGGGVYISTDEANPVTLFNSSIYKNAAKNGGGIAFIPNVGNNGKLKIILCTYCANATSNEWYSFDLAWQYYLDPVGALNFQDYCEMFGNVIIEEKLPLDAGEDEDGVEYSYPWNETLPDVDNNFNYIATVEQALERQIAAENENDENHLILTGIEDFPLIDEETLPTLPQETCVALLGQAKIGDNGSKGVELTVGEGDEAKTYSSAYGEELSVPALSKAGHSFVGYVDENGNTVELNDINLSLSFGSLSLIPVFKPNEYKLTLNADGNESVISVTYGDEVKLDAPNKRGYDFVGWYAHKDGVEFSLKSGDNYLIDGDLTLYAVFEKKFPYALVLGGFLVLAIALFAFVFLIKRKKVAPQEEVLSEGDGTSSQAENTCVLCRLDCSSDRQAIDLTVLTEREKQVFELLLEGKKRAEIAAVLFVSEETVKKQITSIYKKLDVSSRSELFAKFK